MPHHRPVDVHAERSVAAAGGLPVTPAYLPGARVPIEAEVVAR